MLQEFARWLGRSVDGFTASAMAPIAVFVGVSMLATALLMLKFGRPRR